MTTHGRPLPSASETLDAVEVRIVDVVQGLRADWLRIAAGNSDVLADEDVPELIAEAARGGKRVRPEMVFWGWVAAGSPAASHEQVIGLGAALELLHVFALIHDDVMDCSELRRGRPAVHTRAMAAHVALGGHGDADAFGNHIAILAGDLVHSEADALVAPLPAAVRALWREMMVELVLGQRQDLTGAALGRRDLQQALEVARLKTGSYTVQRPLQMGAVLAGADPTVVDALVRFGWHAGEAFGLRDDVLGVWGDPASTGKSDEDDLCAGKATVLLALAADHLSPQGRALLDRAGTEALSHDDVGRLRAEMDACGVRERVEEMIASEAASARSALDAPLLPEPARHGLTAILDRLAWRNA